MRISFDIPGPPEGKARPRFDGKRGRAYTPRQTVQYEQLVQWAFRQKCRYIPFENDEPLRVSIQAHYERPHSASRITHQKMAAGVIRPTKKPDWDNIGKIVCDALNGIAYRDDAQIVEAHVIKVYCCDGEEPHVEVTIEAIQEASE